MIVIIITLLLYILIYGRETPISLTLLQIPSGSSQTIFLVVFRIILLFLKKSHIDFGEDLKQFIA